MAYFTEFFDCKGVFPHVEQMSLHRYISPCIFHNYICVSGDIGVALYDLM